ncbi:hypothetical protein [Reichenbachiella sp. MSK19-1]|uniref:hypothetical protein n=1 Tax=Reichenbachiella sp. MSK19-1 TaxID=1897631 RepID=UPI000E6C5682|nr:hypothetical protein [Reichenbachiella sp. MSK19-1]RJE75730.1 hypothetical protein BGP76_11595 [Reichenbachiella sp. MSK19-1]
MKKLLSLLMMAGVMASMISCSEDDGGSIDGDGDGDGVDGNVLVEANISADETWTSDNVYELGGRITVLDGATLTIEAGTIIKGQAGTGSNATALMVARGGMLMAEGTADAPIIFTSVADEITPEDVAAGNTVSPNLNSDINGLWGGVLVLGRAPIIASNWETGDKDQSEVTMEGIPSSDTNAIYGGSDPEDNSGVLKYISIRNAGSLIAPGNEINGLSLGGVGSGTTIENIEVVANQDDGIEIFGGTVDITNVLVWNSSDDALDTDQDWTGTLNNFIIIDPRDGGSGFELDGPEGESASTGCHTFINGTVYASNTGLASLVDWDDNTNAQVKNVYFYGMAADYVDGIASYNGSGCGTSDGWEATLADGVEVADVFGDVTVSIVAKNANTVGADASKFGWTWAAKAGKLAEIGL